MPDGAPCRPIAPSAAAQRQRRRRQRQRLGLIPCTVWLDEFALVNMLMRANLLTEANADDRAEVQATLQRMLAGFLRRLGRREMGVAERGRSGRQH
jgi:hypothetical protein